MKVAPPTPDEKERLAELYAYDVLDSEAEQIFDDLTQLASDICNTPIALISLVDVNRQWFKARVGLDATETHRDLAFCAHAIHGHKVFEVPDASKDARFADNPLVTQAPDIRFYAGAPLISPNGHAIGTLCAIDRVPKQLTEQQKRALNTLAHEVISQLELRQKIRQLEEARANGQRFLSQMSHELRTPLNAIVGFAGLLQNKQREFALPVKAQNYLANISFSAHKLSTMINSVLDMAKIEAGKIELNIQPLNLPLLLSGSVAMLQSQAREKGLHLHTDIGTDLPHWILADETKLGQILINLLGNAIKFSHAGQAVRLTVRLRSDHLHISVADEGIGISSEQASRLFQPFEQSHTDISRRFGGTGLGLAISQRLAQLMGSQIHLRSELGKGSLFYFDLPFEACMPPEQMAAPREIKLHKANVLVVEDNLINQEVLAAMLEDTPLQLTLCDNAEDALQKLTQQLPDLVLMDIHLPGMDGRAASRIIRAQYPNLPVIALSADVLGGQENGDAKLFDGFLAKPLDPSLLISTLARHLPKRPG